MAEIRARKGVPVQSGGNSKREPSLDVEERKHAENSSQQLGFLHWLLIFVTVAALYGSVVWLDLRMPPVVPASEKHSFSEERARRTLNALADLGPRQSGSENCEIHAFRIITSKINELTQVVNRIGANRLEMDVQRPSGCFDLQFLSVFTLCYHKITNIVARIGPKSGPTDHAILINCHFDTLPDTPGATDDAVSCAIMMDVLEVLANSDTALENDILFLFNGAEENFLQASHGFITEHPWRHPIRAFINLEGCGSGGRELLFQTGPGESWLVKTYLDNAPHPHCSVLGQEIFQLGVIPSDTDFRVFRDYGRISGFDIAYIRNGWVYHTEFDRPELIEPGAIQRSGENIVAVARALIRSPYLQQPANFAEGNKWVFFDVVGLFTVFYGMTTATLLNYFTVALAFVRVWLCIRSGVYTVGGLFAALAHQLFAFGAMLVTGFALVLAICALNMHMAWYSMPELVFPIYIVPMLTASIWAHGLLAERERRNNKNARPLSGAEKAHYDLTMVEWALVLLLLTWLGAASSFLFFFHVFFPLLREPAIALFRSMGIVRTVTPRVLFAVQLGCLVPLVLIVSSYTQLLFDFFVPVMGRLGNVINPELVMMPFALLVASTFIMFTNNLIYVSRRLHFMVKCLAACSLFALLIIATTSVGVPYKYSVKEPRMRRIIALHARRRIYNFVEDDAATSDGPSLNSSETALFVTSLDYRGTDDLPEHTFLQGRGWVDPGQFSQVAAGSGPPDCAHTADEYCQLPYYTAVHELFPPQHLRWIPLPAEPPIPQPLSVELLQRQHLPGNRLNVTISVRGGADKASMHITPLDGYQLRQWSLTAFDPATFGSTRSTYFVFMTFGYEAPAERVFWILLENQHKNVSAADPGPNLELAVATHYTHGKHQNSETLRQLRSLIANRRQTPHAGVGFWRWAITMIAGCSEIVVYFF